MQQIIKRVSSPILVLLGVLSVAGCLQNTEKSEWSGTVSAELSDLGGGSFFMASVLTVPQDDRYILLFDPELMTIGVTDNGGSIVWELGKNYRIRGELVTDPQELEVAERLGFSKIIRANYIELLPDTSQEPITEQGERYSATRVITVTP
jgi:hypothetical protein